MNDTSLARRVSRFFSVVFLCMIGCMALLAGLSVHTLRGIQQGQRSHALSFVPAKRLTAGFEREILNARIFFIYFVTIQKPGSLQSGWARYHNAEAAVRDMSVLIDQHEELGNLRAPVAKLRADVANYGVALTDTLNMVQRGELKGEHYDAQVKEWAARGAVMVADAASVESLCFRSGEADSNEISSALGTGQTQLELIFAGSFLACLLVTILMTKRLTLLIADLAPSNTPHTGLYPDPTSTPGLGASTH